MTGLAVSMARPLEDIVEKDIFGQLRFFFEALTSQKDSLVLDGIQVFAADDQFLPGKIAAALAHLVVREDRDSPELQRLLAGYRSILDFTVGMRNESWGIYYACAGLYALKKAGLLSQAVSDESLCVFRERADWRRFVNSEGWTLIDLPTNYYGVAFSIARLRMLMGWEDACASEALLEKTLNHYDAHSGTFGFCDDTDGQGRFDRYSILLIAEICERFIETNLTVTPKLLALLRNAVNVALKLGSTQGSGFCFGRSLGPYGDTAMLQILSVAGYLKVLTPEESIFAYSMSVAIVEKYIGFWFNSATHSVDMWEQGRRVDAYRGKSRILGENLSLLHQIVSASQLWSGAGFQGVLPQGRDPLQTWLDTTQQPFSLIPFATGTYERALAIYRDRGRVFSLLLVNGGTNQHMNSPYYPLPFSVGGVEGIADSGAEFTQLLPKLVLEDGTQLLGTAFFRNIRCTAQGTRHIVTYQMDAVTRLGADSPIADDRVAMEVEYSFDAGTITRTDRFVPKFPFRVRHITLDFLSFSSAAITDHCELRFQHGAVTEFQTSGFDSCEATPLQNHPSFRSPNGPMHTWVRCHRGSFVATEPFTLQWKIRYI